MARARNSLCRANKTHQPPIKTAAYDFALFISYKVFELLTQTYLNVSGVTAGGRGLDKKRLGVDMGNKNAGLPMPAGRFERSRWRRRLGGVASTLATCAVGLWAPHSFAQDAPQGDAASLEEIVITGSRIKRENPELGRPVTPGQAEGV